MNEQEPEYIGVSKAARVLGTSEVTIRRWTKLGRLQGYRVCGGPLRYRLADVQRLAQPEPVGAPE